jgi:hypothetical protein
MTKLLPHLPLAVYASSSRGAAAKRTASSTALATAGGEGASTGPPASVFVRGAVGLDIRGALRGAGLPVLMMTSEAPTSTPPADTSRMSVVAQLLFGAALHALPASSRTWFSDLRDRGTSVAVEAYTAAAISPALLESELQHVQVRVCVIVCGGAGVRACFIKPDEAVSVILRLVWGCVYYIITENVGTLRAHERMN